MTIATSTRFARTTAGYDGNTILSNYQKYQTDSQATPKVAINSEKIDGDFNNIINFLNLLDDDLASLALGGMSNNLVTNAYLRDSAGLSVIGRGSNTTGDPADLVAGTDGHVLRRSGTTLAFGLLGSTSLDTGCITSAKIAASAVTFDKIASGAIATQAEAESGTSSTKLMTPQRNKQAFDEHYGDRVWTGTQDEYDAIGTKVSTTLYFITES